MRCIRPVRCLPLLLPAAARPLSLRPGTLLVDEGTAWSVLQPPQLSGVPEASPVAPAPHRATATTAPECTSAPRAVLQTLFDALKRAHSDAAVKAIVITGAGGKFSGGFDISQFQKQEGGAAISDLVNKSFLDLVETGPKPTVAALSTIALGGGCELAVSCNARVATPGAPPPPLQMSPPRMPRPPDQHSWRSCSTVIATNDLLQAPKSASRSSLSASSPALAARSACRASSACSARSR